MSEIRDLGVRIKDCVLEAVIGEQLGRGCYRTVYALGDDRVVKVETDGKNFCNAHEWSIWQEVQGTKWEKWFAPCLQIDYYATALVQARTRPMTDRQWKALKEVPNFMADLKPDNWGIYKGRPVCHDYGNHRFFSKGLTGGKLVARKD